MEEEDLTALLSGATHLAVCPELRGNAEHFPATDLAAVRAQAPDVLLRFGFNILGGEVLTLPRHGVWSFHHGDPEKYRGGPPGFWEIMNGDPITGAVLQRLTPRLDAGPILRQGWFNTVGHSLRETVDTVLMHTACWPSQVLRELLLGHEDAAVGRPPQKHGRLYRYPGNLAFLHFLLKQTANKWDFHRRELREHEDWNCAVLYQRITDLVTDDLSRNVRWLPPPSPQHYRADPFGYIDAAGQLHMLYERFDHATGRGAIARLRPKHDNVLKRSRTLLEDEAHRSYPFIVQRGNEVFVVPEQAATGRTELYRLTPDHERLEPITTLVEEPLFDPTLVEHEGRWWLFGTKAPLTNVELHAYHADRLEGPYQPHALNPVKLDIRSARPAGTPFQVNGVLYRPAQDSSLTYGGRIALNRVDVLTPELFRETTVKHIGPMPDCAWDKGMHTLSAVGEVCFIDGKRHVSVPERRKAVRARKLRRLKPHRRKR
jgi:hypothetical protein